MAERLGRSLQNFVLRFKSARDLNLKRKAPIWGFSFFSSIDTQNSSSYLDSSNQEQSPQNSSSNFNVERNIQENLNERTTNLRDENPSVLNYFLDMYFRRSNSHQIHCQ